MFLNSWFTVIVLFKARLLNKLMNTFLSKISKLDTVQDVILLSSQGEPLFFTRKNNTTVDEDSIFIHWNEILSVLNKPQTAKFVFSGGSYYLCYTDIGYVIVSLTDENTLQMIKQACSTILTKLSNPTLCKRVLLNLLSTSSDTFKPNIIKELVPYADEELAAVLIFLLQKQHKLAPGKKENLLLLICQVLGYCSSYNAVDVLKEFLASRRPELNTPGNEIFEAVRISIEQLNRHKAKSEKLNPAITSQKQVKARSNGVHHKPQPQKAMAASQTASQQEEQIKTLLDKGDKEKATLFVIEHIEKCCKNKQFTNAYELRDRLIEINPMALTEIIHTAEIIEAAKQSSIDAQHSKTWNALVALLSPEEFSSLYHIMIPMSYPSEKIIVQQGSKARTLLFVNSGQVQIQALNQGELIPLQVKEAGEIIGAGTFFEASVWTINVKSLNCELFLLPRAKLDTLKKHHPALESKLFSFCSAFQPTSKQLKKSRKNRRKFLRRDVSGRMVFSIIDTSGKEISSEAKGNLLDISPGGLAFSIHSSKKKNAMALFGRQLKITLNTGVGSSTIVRRGTVQAVRDIDLVGNEYSLHIEFARQLNGVQIQQILHIQKSGI